MASQKGKMGSAPTFSKPNLNRLRTGHRAEPTWRFIPDHDVCPLIDRACALSILRGSQVSSVKFPRLDRSFYFDETHAIDTAEKISAERGV
jgi:hypothetical protein